MSYSKAGLTEAYLSIYEDKSEVEELGYLMIENAAQVLFSQGYTVEDLCDYFEEANTEVIAEDFVGFTEGKAYLSESLIVPQQHIDEQFRRLNEVAGLIRGAVKLGSKIFGAGAGAMKGGGGAKAALGAMKKSAGRSLKQGLQSASQFAKTKMGQVGNVLKKLPGAGAATNLAKSPVGRLASRVAPGLGVAAYGMDAASRFKKGDWGGGLLSTAGAVTSAIPGAGLVAGLAPAAIQMGTDALGWTGDKSKKGGPKPAKTPTPPKLPSTSSTPSTPSAPSAPKSTLAPAKTSPANASTADKIKLGTQTYKQQVKSGDVKGAEKTGKDVWALANPKLSAKLTPSGSQKGTGKSEMEKGAEELRRMSNRSKQSQGALMGGPEGPGKIDTKSVDDAIAAEKKRQEQRKKTPAAAGVSEAYDIVLDYLLSEGHADTVEEAHYIMLQMDAEYIQEIVSEGYQRDPEKGEAPDRSREAIPGQAPRGMPPRGNADREAFEKWYRLQQASKKGKGTAKA